jgi:signal transduction histidine kinase
MEEEIRANLRSVNSLIQALDDLIIIKDEHGNQVEHYCNHLEKFGFASLEVDDKGYEYVKIPAVDTYKRFIEAIQEAGTSSKGVTFDFKHEDQWYECTINKFEIADASNRFVAQFKNVTQLKTISFDLKKALDEQIEANQMKSQFISMASHQFRTPLTVILSNMQLFDLLTKEQDPKFLTISGRIQTEVKRLTSLMDDVLVLGKVDSGNYSPDISAVDLEEIIRNCIEDAQLQFPDNNPFKAWMANTDPLILESDRYLLEHIFNNLISNALKFSKGKKSPEVRVQVKRSAFEIRVKDYGIGIAQEELGKVFAPFYRAKNADGVKGTGLGLSIVKEFCNLIGAEISVESEIGRYTEFIVVLPKT